MLLGSSPFDQSHTHLSSLPVASGQSLPWTQQMHLSQYIRQFLFSQFCDCGQMIPFPGMKFKFLVWSYGLCMSWFVPNCLSSTQTLLLGDPFFWPLSSTWDMQTCTSFLSAWESSFPRSLQAVLLPVMKTYQFTYHISEKRWCLTSLSVRLVQTFYPG